MIPTGTDCQNHQRIGTSIFLLERAYHETRSYFFDPEKNLRMLLQYLRQEGRNLWEDDHKNSQRDHGIKHAQ